MNDDIASILFRPICSKCKHILYTEINCSEYPILTNYYSGCYLGYYEITPEKCPYCNAIFNNIEMPTKLPFGENT